MNYLKDNKYEIEYLIYSPYERRYGDNSVEYQEWQDFQGYTEHFIKAGTKIYTPYRQDDFSNPWWTVDGLRIWIIGPEKNIATSDTRELHDASLVFTIKGEKRTCLFTGDASDASLNWIAKNTKNHCNDILHASHHGSLNGADLEFIKSCNIVHTIISTKSGEHDSVPHPTALARYNKNSTIVYRTDVSGILSYNNY
jgi:beta-lactamase superfamily II metal-dependent hydrolase